MVRYVLSRLGQAVLSLYVLATILFFMFRLLPGDPTTAMLDAALPPEAQEAVRRQFGLDKPLLTQYWIYLNNLVRGNFGISFSYRIPVFDVIGEKLINTAWLMGSAILVAMGLGSLLGALLAWYRNTWIESVGLVVGLTLRSAPVYWTGILALTLFAFKLPIFPIGGMTSPGREFASAAQQFLNWDFLHHLILPSLVAGLYMMATPMLIMRSAMLEVLGEDFVEMARAKGLKERVILFRHVVRNALLPVVTEATLLIGFAIGGQVLVETIFRWPGLGREIVLAIQRNDYPMAQATFLFMGLVVVILNLITDLLYARLDPRITYR